MSTDRHGFEDLVAIMARLRAPGGCPWDREQTHASLQPYLLEETYETLEAIDAGAADKLREELGDLLLQVVFHAQMAAEAGSFTIDDVVAGLSDKLVRRHPHVFGDADAATADAVLKRWEVIKAAERAGTTEEPGRAPSDGEPQDGALGGLPRALPALALAQQMQARAARAGFEWLTLAQATAKVREELTELERAHAGEPPDRVAEELGDLLFTVANLPRYLGLDGEQTLRAACAKFRDRFARLEQTVRAGGRSLRDCPPEELAALWRAVR
ncbi:MAG TPA: nucleoside triphosphate pyrophosphohydrolase [bacterium]|nr:nucleoside triphosphate pyrophosphohydrolase [bacterium]